MTFSVSNGVEFVDCGCCTANNIIDIVGGNVAELAENVLADAKGYGGVGMDESDKSFDNIRRRQRVKHIAGKWLLREAWSAVVAILFEF
jgi:hypothetical protein